MCLRAEFATDSTRTSALVLAWRLAQSKFGENLNAGKDLHSDKNLFKSLVWDANNDAPMVYRCGAHHPCLVTIDLSLLEHVSPIEWDNVVLYGQYILDRKLVRRRRRAKKAVLSI